MKPIINELKQHLGAELHEQTDKILLLFVKIYLFY